MNGYDFNDCKKAGNFRVPSGEEYSSVIVGDYEVLWARATSHYSLYFCVLYRAYKFEDHWEYQKGHTDVSPDPTSNINEAEVLVYGTLKFDGCCDFKFPSDIMLHTCGLNMWKSYNAVMETVYGIGKSYLKNWCGD